MWSRQDMRCPGVGVWGQREQEDSGPSSFSENPTELLIKKKRGFFQQTVLSSVEEEVLEWGVNSLA